MVTAFGTAASGTPTVGNGTVTHGARATLLALRRVTDSMSGNTETLQKWEITDGAAAAASVPEVEVTRHRRTPRDPALPLRGVRHQHRLRRAVLRGRPKTKSYNSQALNAGNPVVVNTDGDVGTNGNLEMQGNPTIINGYAVHAAHRGRFVH